MQLVGYILIKFISAIHIPWSLVRQWNNLTLNIWPMLISFVSKFSVAFSSEIQKEEMNQSVLLHPPVSDWFDPALVVYFFGMTWSLKAL